MRRVNKYRKILRVEKKSAISVRDPHTFYIIGVDVGRYVANTSIWVVKCLQEETRLVKKVVYGVVLFDKHTNEQALCIKRMIVDYSPREVVIDGTGMGVTLIDAMTIPTRYDWRSFLASLINDEDYEGVYDRDAPKLIYRIVASPTLNTAIHTNFYTQLMAGHVRFLASELVARSKLLTTKKGQK